MYLLDNLTAVTMDAERRILRDAAIAIDGPEIVAVDESSAVKKRFPGTEIVDATGMTAIPGLIDTHAHADQSLLRGLGDGMHWIPFIDDVVEPYLAKRDPAIGVLANTLSMIEMLRSGTTCFVSPNVDPRDDYALLADAIGKLGIRAVLGRYTMPDARPDSVSKARNAAKSASRIMRDWHGSADGLVSMWFGLHVPRRAGDTDHPHFYEAVANEAAALGVGITYHFCSEIEDADYIVEHYGMRPAEWSRDNHALGDNVLLINGCQMTDPEIGILADSGTHLAHSPVANMKMATGILPLTRVLATNVNVSLGTDGALNNNSYDMFAEMKTAVLLQNAINRSASAMTAATALEMATINGAKAIGRRDQLGSIELGKQADIVLLDMRQAFTAPVHDVLSNIVFAANRSTVDTVIIAGRKVVERGVVTGVDEASVIDEAKTRADELRKLIIER
ncbi:MAG: amidohydrolase [Gammaproteobacteria bacterium]|nr:amidohydrolase [Gammaproteobacteria bacterium]